MVAGLYILKIYGSIRKYYFKKKLFKKIIYFQSSKPTGIKTYVPPMLQYGYLYVNRNCLNVKNTKRNGCPSNMQICRCDSQRS